MYIFLSFDVFANTVAQKDNSSFHQIKRVYKNLKSIIHQKMLRRFIVKRYIFESIYSTKHAHVNTLHR